MPTNEQLRQRILDDLSGQFAHDRIGLEDYERRVGAVAAARDDRELVALNADILPAERYRSATPAAAGAACRVYDGESPATEHFVAIFSGSNLEGEFKAPRKLDALCIFGGVNIDLRKAAIPADGMVIDTVAVFGGVEILVPPGVRVQVEGVAVFGGYNRPRASLDESGPLIRVRGVALFGGVDIKVKTPR